MKPPNDESPVAGAPGKALDTSVPTARGKPNASRDGSREPAVRKAKNCVSCGAEFVPLRGYFRKCRDCTARFKQARIDLIKKRTNDGCIAFKLLEHARQLRSDDPEAKAWLASLIAKNGDER